MPVQLLPRKRFYFIRHGETDWNVQGIGQGISDPDLNEQGKKQAKEAASILYYLKASAGTIVSSPLGRALETAKVIGRKFDSTVHTLSNLKELNLGELEGVVMPPLSDFIAKWKKQEITGSENFQAMKKRVMKAMVHILEPAEEPSLIVGHGIFYIVLSELMHFPLALPANCQPILHTPVVNGDNTKWIRSALTLSGKDALTGQLMRI